MITPEEYNEQYFKDDNLDLVDLIREIQAEAWNEAIEAAAENAELRFIPFSDNMEVNEKSILKLKK